MTRRFAWSLCAAGGLWLAACSGAAVRTDARPAAPAPDPQTVFARALAAQEAGQRDAAIALWKDLVALAPDRAAPHVNLGIVYRLDGRLDDAIAEYEAAIRLDPADAAAHHNLGLARRAQGAWPLAEHAYLRALELRPNQVETHYNLGILYDLFLNRPEDALTQYRTVVTLGGPYADTVALWIPTLERRLAQPAAPSPDAP